MGKKILLADDSLTIQKIVELTFEGEGFDLEVVADGQEALQRAEASPPDIILADYTMPGLSGTELCRKIREHPVLKATPVILLTNSFDEFDRAEGEAAGVTDYVEKPFESQALVDRVHELISGESPPAPPELHPPADEVDHISEEREEEVEQTPVPTERKELLWEFHEATAAAAPREEGEDLLILDEVIETEAEVPAVTAVESEVAIAPTNSEGPEEVPEDREAAGEEPSAEEVAVPEEPILAGSDLADDDETLDELPPTPPLEAVTAETAAAGTTLEESVGDAVRDYIDQLIHQAVEELTPTIASEVAARLEATFPSLAERIIRDEIEKLKRGE